MAGLTAEQIHESRLGHASDVKTSALLSFSQKLVEKRGLVSDADIEAVRQAGGTDSEITEVVAHVALNIFTNYFNHVAGTAIDFPKVEALPSASN